MDQLRVPKPSRASTESPRVTRLGETDNCRDCSCQRQGDGVVGGRVGPTGNAGGEGGWGVGGGQEKQVREHAEQGH